ncbi:inner centromere related pic1 [Fusarium heterosporum]|uniref:Inner centromere related pic1 n=1 Tax=Fusarium heterosporum TaxID=42747 RepID=A0A8H5TBL6_FUSHE|nr:inner centromere related pic1 [Fusarium heterosporum]
MAAIRGPRIPTGSAAWVADERASALQIVDTEVDEFTYAAHNEFAWLNEHMAGIFSESERNIAETFKTPGKLRGKTPRTTRKLITTEPRVPLSNVFGGTPSSSANRFAQHLHAQSPQRELMNQVKSSSPRRHAPLPATTQVTSGEPISDSTEQDVIDTEDIHSDHDVPMNVEEATDSPQATKSQPPTQGDSGYFGSQDVNATHFDPVSEDDMSVVDPTALDEAIAFPQSSPSRTSPAKQLTESSSPARVQQVPTDMDMEEAATEPEQDDASPDDVQSQSDDSSPARPGFRKSLQFPSLPAREPLAAGKNAGARASRTSHVDLKRTSYLGRSTRGKSLVSHSEHDESDESDQDEMEVDDLQTVPPPKNAEDLTLHHNKTYTQMLQDKISVLGKSQPNGSRPSKSIHSITNSQHSQAISQSAAESKSPSPPSPKKQEFTTTPGAFPDDDDDDWIVPPTSQQHAAVPTPTRPSLSKSRTADVMEGIHGKQTLGSFDLDVDRANIRSPARFNSQSERPSYLRHSKSVSVPVVPLATALEQEGSPLKKTISASSQAERPDTTVEAASSSSPSKSPSRLFRDSPLKHLKNKMSSILSTSKGLIASSAALSAEGKSSLLSPSRAQLGLYPGQSSESIAPKSSMESFRSGGLASDQQSTLSRPVAKRTRASVEREKEEKRREKEARVQAEQFEKLEKEREKERDKARVFSKEQEKLATMEKQVAARKEVETPAPKPTSAPTRTSPRRAKERENSEPKVIDQDEDMVDAYAVAPPPSAHRPTAPNTLSRPKEIRRIAKPAREPTTKTKVAPTVHIKVNTGSQLYPGNAPASGFPELGTSINSQPQQIISKASKASTQPKPSASAFGASTGSNGRPRALDMATQKKAQDEAQRRRDAKAKMERERGAKDEKRKQELLRRQEEERQKRDQTDAKKNAQRQAIIEKAKKTPAPPPAVRSQPNGPPDYNLQQDKSASVQRGDGPPRPPSRMNSGIYRSQDEMGRPVNAILANGSKPASKRLLGRDGNDDGPARPPPSRGPQYQAKDAKRRRTSDDFADELDNEQLPNIKGPPVRPSSALKRDLQAKTLTSGYVSQTSAQNLFKTTIAQSHMKGGNPMDMAQIHKGTIPFAPNPNPAGPAYKTPGRPGPVGGIKSAAKSVQRSSPRFQNGEAIELPEIQTDDEDEDDDEPHAGTIAAWANSPFLTQTLYKQEGLDPAAIFGPPMPLNMEEVFDKSKDRHHKFRARTSSANWSGNDRLTEDDIRKDLAARDKLRREGGWSYELSKEMM